MTPFDRWLTREPDTIDRVEVEYKCPDCGLPPDEHDLVQRTDADGGDYETLACPVTV